MEPQQQGKGGRSLPKFGEWDVRDPASADGFTVIFAKARDEKKAKVVGRAPPPPPQPTNIGSPQFSGKKKWLCCFPVGTPVSNKPQSLEHY